MKKEKETTSKIKDETNRIEYRSKFNNINRKLIEKKGNRCNICGKESEFLELDYIIPISLGGTSEIENLQLLCPECHRNKNIKLIYTEVFEEYIIEMIKLSGRYDIIEINQLRLKHKIDLFLKDKEKEEYYLCEIKANTVFTKDRIEVISTNLKEYYEEIKTKYKNVKIVLIFPGTLSPRNIYFLQLNNIEIWDKDYLVVKFKDEILQLNNPYMNSLFRIFGDKPQQIENKYQEKIDRLKDCKSGIKEWSSYQKLIGEILELLFCPTLNNPIYEKGDEKKINRRDFIMPNYALEGFWNFMRQNYSAEYVVIDAKNSAVGVKKQDILQIANYLNKYRNRIIWNYYC